MNTNKSLLMMKQLESIAAKLECIAFNYRDELDVAIHCINTNLENKLIELVKEFGYEAVDAAVETTAEVTEDNLSIECGPYPSIYEAFDCVPAPEPDEECENALLPCVTQHNPTEADAKAKGETNGTAKTGNKNRDVRAHSFQ
jgi:hypothetical protein